VSRTATTVSAAPDVRRQAAGARTLLSDQESLQRGSFGRAASAMGGRGRAFWRGGFGALRRTGFTGLRTVPTTSAVAAAAAEPCAELAGPERPTTSAAAAAPAAAP